MTKKIIIGHIHECYHYEPPIKTFEKAYQLSKQDDFEIYTNNPQLIEALEVLCGAENIEIYMWLKHKITKISETVAYDYLCDVYEIIDFLRGYSLANGKVTDELINQKIKEYEEKYMKYRGDVE